MLRKTYTFSEKKTAYYFNADFGVLDQLVDPSKGVIITDENIYQSHGRKFRHWKMIVLEPGGLRPHRRQSRGYDTTFDRKAAVTELGFVRGAHVVRSAERASIPTHVARSK